MELHIAQRDRHCLCSVSAVKKPKYQWEWTSSTTTATEYCLCVNNTELHHDLISPLGGEERRQVLEGCYEASSEVDLQWTLHIRDKDT